MAEVAPRPQGLRAKLGFGPKKKASTRKLVKKNGPREEPMPADPVRQSSFDFFTAPPIPQRPPPPPPPPPFSSSSDHSPLTIRGKKSMEYQAQRNDSVPSTKAAPRKLSKLPHQIPQQRHEDVIDKDTGERKDLTEMMHAFSYQDDVDEVDEIETIVTTDYDPFLPDGATLLARASPELWLLISDYLSPLDVANLASTCRMMTYRLGNLSYKLLRNPANRTHRLDFLLSMDRKLPDYLFCFPCAQWHLRTHPGEETLKPPQVLNPLFRCPNSTNVLLPPPRIRISEGRLLPFIFLQLAKRHWAYGPTYGIPAQSLSRRWKDAYSPWSHESTYYIQGNGHVLMRIKSQVFVEGGMTPAGKRMLLYSRGDYTPYFSVCAHWQKGILTTIPKCALDHIRVPKVNVMNTVKNKAYANKAVGPVSLCSVCQPMRRCTECPSEYLFELKLVEDKSIKSHGPERFRQALLVTRWSDLGPARSTEDVEWAAVAGDMAGYDSIAEIGKRGVSGIFEAAFTDATPGQRILSMDPKKGRRRKANPEEDDGEWY
ncbi:hypothetical protein P280DRAFT_473424 [Massarina eburnea CBS 473.64]|uniref:F-box domain-containing protein n=1 Tax=Massarina eburnea CBS 473.64 TaxID=1395130 RepID=A0A6A6RKD7_9PLEO|nr:hypothetical protein P280DRAFT_473424 [Massarina eburnea CBS 473.64]